MAEIDATTIGRDGRLIKPRVLVVLPASPMLNMLQQSAASVEEAFGCEPVFMCYPCAHTHSGKEGDVAHAGTLDEVVAFVNNPANKIDMVLSGNHHNAQLYGLKLAAQLKQGNPEFSGPIAIQTNGAPSLSEIALAKTQGALGVYESGNALEESGAFSALVSEWRTQGQGKIKTT